MTTTSCSSSLKKLSLLASLVLSMGATCFADPLLLTVNSTPYDSQMAPIHSVLVMGGHSADQTSVQVVNAWMSDLRGIPYGFQRVWRTPFEVQSRQPADCKGKAVALYEKMKSHGATGVRLVIGKRAPTSAKTHAWLEWQTASGRYLLDPTFNYSVTRAEKVRRNSYLPLYEYAGSKKFRAASGLIAQN